MTAILTAASPRPAACSTPAAKRSSRPWRQPPTGLARRRRATLPIQARRRPLGRPLRGMHRPRCRAVRSWRRRRRVPAPASPVLRSSRPASAGPLSPRRLPLRRLAPHRLAPRRLALRRLRCRRPGTRPRRLRLLPRLRRPRPPRRLVPVVRRRYGEKCVRLLGRRPRRCHPPPRRQPPAPAGQALRHPRQVHARPARVRVRRGRPGLVQARRVARASPPRARRPRSAALRSAWRAR